MHGYILLGVSYTCMWSSAILSTDFHLRQNSSSYNFYVCITVMHVALIECMQCMCVVYPTISSRINTHRVLVKMQVAMK